MVQALQSFDGLYPQENEESALQQLQVQLSNPLPYDLDEVEPGLSEYKNLELRWREWDAVKGACGNLSTVIFDRVCGRSLGEPGG